MEEKRDGEAGRYSDIFHFVSNRGIAIRGVTLAASSGKQVVATVLLLEHETGERHTGKCRMPGRDHESSRASYSNRM